MPVCKIKNEDEAIIHKKMPSPQYFKALNKAEWERDVYLKAKERNLSEHRSGVTGALLISSKIKSQLFAGTKAASEETSPPRARWSAFRAP